jgi:RNA polymerase sigma factor (sigma-70 family)
MAPARSLQTERLGVILTKAPRNPGSPVSGSPADLESTADLLELTRQGDMAARDRLAGRYLPVLMRWARGRLPIWARDLSDTDDLVQVTLTKALDKVNEFEPRREGAFLAYLRTILQNQIRDQIRRVTRKPKIDELDETVADDEPSPLEETIGREALVRYETALSQLPDRQREAVVLRIELGFTHQQVADAVGCPSDSAARMMLSRALAQLAEKMDER